MPAAIFFKFPHRLARIEAWDRASGHLHPATYMTAATALTGRGVSHALAMSIPITLHMHPVALPWRRLSRLGLILDGADRLAGLGGADAITYTVDRDHGQSADK